MRMAGRGNKGEAGRSPAAHKASISKEGMNRIFVFNGVPWMQLSDFLMVTESLGGRLVKMQVPGCGRESQVRGMGGESQEPALMPR